jgi:DNA polymerase V
MTKGGRRQGAGRPTGTGRYGEPTVPVRVPASQVGKVKEMLAAGGVADAATRPLYGGMVQAGLPAAADDHIEAELNLHNYLVTRPAETFFVRAQGQSMINAGIFDGDLLVVDRSIAPRHGLVVVAALDGELTVKRLEMAGQRLRLLPENPAYPPIEVGEEQNCHIWGVVTSVVHEMTS